MQTTDPETAVQDDRSWLAQYYVSDKGDTVICGSRAENALPGEDDNTATLSRMPVDKYAMETPCGRGGMKTVFAARDRDAGRRVALAMLRKDDEKTETMRRFIHEARITAFLEHPNIVPVHDVGLDPRGRPYYTMKLLEGRTLQDILRDARSGVNECRQKCTLPYMLEIFLRICDAVGFAHSRGVIHLDLKPANVQVGAFGEVLVIDWGLAKFIDEPDVMTPEYRELLRERTDLTVVGDVVGTPGYMAPEQALGLAQHKDTRTDIYALGAILYAMLTWVSPGEGDTVDDVLANTKTGKLTPPRQRAPERKIPAALEAVVIKAMATDPDRRYRKVEELSGDIMAYTGGFAPAAQDVGLHVLLWLFVKRHRLVTALTATSLAVIAALITAFVVKVKASETRAVANFERYRAEHGKYVAEQEQKNKYGRIAAPGVVTRADRHLRAMNFEDALRDYELATTLDADLRNAWLASGMLCLGGLRFGEAAAALARAEPTKSDKQSSGNQRTRPVQPARKSRPQPTAIGGDPVKLAVRYALLSKDDRRTLSGDQIVELVAAINNLNGANVRQMKERVLGMLFHTLSRDYPLADRLAVTESALRVLNPKAEACRFRTELVGDGELSAVVTGGAEVADIKPLFGLPVARLDLSDTGVTDLKWLTGMPLAWLDISRTQVRDLSVLATTGVAHIRALDAPALDLTSLGRLPTLQTIEVDESVSAKAEAALRKYKKTVVVHGRNNG